jgi:chemotaxis signal transduction protein
VILRFGMNKSDSDRVHELCSLIVVEQNRDKFLQLVGELNRILSANETRFQNASPDDQEND